MCGTAIDVEINEMIQYFVRCAGVSKSVQLSNVPEKQKDYFSDQIVVRERASESTMSNESCLSSMMLQS